MGSLLRLWAADYAADLAALGRFHEIEGGMKALRVFLVVDALGVVNL